MADVFHPPDNVNNEETDQDLSSMTVETSNEEEGNEANRNCNVTRDDEDRLTFLRSQVAKKNKEVEREKALRRAAEKRQLDTTLEETFVDPYAGSNPSVNEELKERLSTKNRLNRLLGERHSPQSVSQPAIKERHCEQITNLPENRPSSRSSESSSTTMGDQEAAKGSPKKMPDTKRGNHHRRHTPENYTSPPRHVVGPYGSWYEESRVYPGGMYTIHNPWLSPHRVVHYEGPAPHSLPVVGQNLSDNDIPAQTGRQSRSPIRDGSYQSRTAPLHSTPVANGRGTPSAYNRSFGIPVNGILRPNGDSRHNISEKEGSIDKSINFSGDLSEGLPFIIKELGSSKDLNKELSEKLSEAEDELDSLQIKQSLCEAMIEAEVAAKGAALVEEIFTAQKVHDEAILSRMKLANDERDDALNRAKRLEEKDGFDSGTDVNSNDDDYSHTDVALRKLVKKLDPVNSSNDIRKYGHAIVNHIGSSKDRRKRITSEEMRTIIEEKDAAITLNKKLEREIIQLKKNQEDSSFDQNSVDSLKVELKSSKRERDAALLKAKKLQEDLENQKMYYSLHKSLSQESQLRDQFNNSLVTIESQVKSRDQVLAKAQEENSQLSSQLKAIVNERSSLALRVQQLEQESAIMKQDNQKQERLVSVLRKKVTEGMVKTVI